MQSFIFCSVNFTLVESCLSLQCSSGDTRFIPHKCSESLKGLCENSSNVFKVIPLCLYILYTVKLKWQENIKSK